MPEVRPEKDEAMPNRIPTTVSHFAITTLDGRRVVHGPVPLTRWQRIRPWVGFVAYYVPVMFAIGMCGGAAAHDWRMGFCELAIAECGAAMMLIGFAALLRALEIRGMR